MARHTRLTSAGKTRDVRFDGLAALISEVDSVRTARVAR